MAHHEEAPHHEGSYHAPIDHERYYYPEYSTYTAGFETDRIEHDMLKQHSD